MSRKAAFLIMRQICSGQCCAQLNRNDATSSSNEFCPTIVSFLSDHYGMVCSVGVCSWLFTHSHIYILERSQHKVPEEALKVDLSESLSVYRNILFRLIFNVMSTWHLYGNLFPPLNKRQKKVIATYKQTILTFFFSLWEINS